MSVARFEARCITLSHRLFWKMSEKDFWAVASVIMFMELDLSSITVKAVQFPSSGAIQRVYQME